MNATDYFPSNPGSWYHIHHEAQKIAMLDFRNTSFFNLSFSSSKGNFGIETFHSNFSSAIISFFSGSTAKRYSTKEATPPVSRKQSSKYELRRSLPLEVESPESFKPGVCASICVFKYRPAFSDIFIRLSPHWRIKLGSGGVHGQVPKTLAQTYVAVEYDNEKTNAEFCIPDRSEFSVSFLRNLTDRFSIGGLFSNKFIEVKSKELKPENIEYKAERGDPNLKSRFDLKLGFRYSTLSDHADNSSLASKDVSNIQSAVFPSIKSDFFSFFTKKIPFEIAGTWSIGKRVSLSMCSRFLDDSLQVAVLATHQFNGLTSKSKKLKTHPDQASTLSSSSITAAIKYSTKDTTLPMFSKLVLDYQNGLGSFAGIRISNVGIGVATWINPYTYRSKTAIFIEL